MQVEEKNYLRKVLFVLRVSSVDGTAIAGRDYTAVLNKRITFTSPTTQDIAIEIIDDEIIEDTKFFLVTVFSLHANTTIGSNSNATVTIIDNDGKRFP